MQVERPSPWYIGTPYTLYPAGREAAFEEACRQVALLLKAGIEVYCPIAEMHPIAIHGGIDPADHAFWQSQCEPRMRWCCGLIVCQMDGWRESAGLSKEIAVFQALGRPIVWMEPGIVPGELL